MNTDALRTPLDEAALREGLVGPSLPWRRLDVVVETGSTNADLLARADGGVGIDGAVPARVTEMPATAEPNRAASTGSAPRARAAAKPPVKASPAPMVSAT